jgi:hypothetical protein
MTIEWFDAAKAVQFGASLADFFIDRIPLSPEKKKAKNLDKQFEVVDKLYVRVEQFKANNKLNLYKKAKLADAFKSKLIDAGYDSKLVDEVTLGIVKIL